MTLKRMHPFKIMYSFMKTLKNSLFILIYLFVLNFNDDSTFIKFAKIAFLMFLVFRFIYLVIEWWNTKYGIKDRSIHFYQGLFKKKNRSIPLKQVQNIQFNSPFFYRMFHLTSLSLETSSTNEEATLKFEAINKKEAESIEHQLDPYKSNAYLSGEEYDFQEPIRSERGRESNRNVQFTPTRKDVLKASFLSFSFLALIPILVSTYHEFNNVIHLDDNLDGIWAFLTSSWLIIGTAVTLFVIIAITFGMIRTFLKYGKYEIASDPERIYIHSGLLNERSFSIRKEDVQAIQMTQTFLKRILGLAEVKLISAENINADSSEEISTLYPFLPIKRTYSLIQELLPDFQISQTTDHLPGSALFMRMLRIPWFWIISTVLLLWLIPQWWYLSLILLVITYLLRILHYRNTRYVMNKEFIQFELNGLNRTLFITNRQKIVEAEVEQTLLQKKFGLATIRTINRTKPIHHEEMKDVSVETSKIFLSWYQNRKYEIQTE
ncbi:putative membrane protein [Salinibacillus kushneri]|uniref:Putative membrane protein n=1 Tax=Salinibacillus kushneri TaxID=237682 RepID=A0A1I0IH92_9BACI|nr:PH domain-containing protein [Salinibacillus kushneri]SET96362.1 putative membrane protein [Salinibacillus kushneri]